MISGEIRILARTDGRMGRLLKGPIALLALSATTWVHAQSWGLPELMQTLAQQKVAKATFTEKKFMAVMEQPLESSGELSYVAPDKLEKRTINPRAETLVLEGDRLVMEMPGRRRNAVSLQAHPEVAPFVESIRGTMAGDLAALQKYYAVDFAGRADAWKLVLVPSQASMRKVMSRIRVEGTHDALTLIVFEQADGDRSEMRIQPVKTP